MNNQGQVSKGGYIPVDDTRRLSFSRLFKPAHDLYDLLKELQAHTGYTQARARKTFFDKRLEDSHTSIYT